MTIVMWDSTKYTTEVSHVDMSLHYIYYLSCTVMRRLTTGIRSEKCVVGGFVIVRTS